MISIGIEAANSDKDPKLGLIGSTQMLLSLRSISAQTHAKKAASKLPFDG